MNADGKFEKLATEMIDKFLKNNPDFATELGLHDPYDYEMPEGTTYRLLKNLKLEEEWLKSLKESVKLEELNDDHKLDYRAIEKFHEDSKFYFYDFPLHELNPNAFEALGGLIFMMLTRDYAPLERRIDAIATRIGKSSKYLEEFRSRFENSKPVRLWTEIAIESAESIRDFFQFLLQVAKGQVSEKVYGRLSKVVEEFQPALKVHIEWLKSLIPNATEKWALGTEKFEKLLKLRQLGLKSEDILKLGEKYLRELKAERKRLANEIAPGLSEKEVMRRIENDAPKTFEEAMEFTEKAMQEAMYFVQKNDLATLYPEDKLYVKETPAFIAPLIPFAAMMMPAKYDKPQVGIYIVTRPKDAANLSNHLNYRVVRNTAVHEAYPGHFLQGAVSNRGSILRLLAGGIETAEGWAHYCEEMMAEKGFITDKETKFIQVNDMIWRAVRIIVDVKLSRNEMTFDQAVEMLVRETGMSKEAATAEARRYTQTPSYALSYLLGKHLILQLKEEVKRKMDGKFNEKFFHDTITANGYLPISMLRVVFDQRIRALKA